MAWLMLVVAGLLEVCWAIGLRYTEGFARPLPSILTLAAIVASMWLLGAATRTLPIGTAYAVWVGIGAVGAAILGVILFREPMSLARGAFILMLVFSIVGLKLTAPAGEAH
jgi:quaternary ammonium compound-resistance protein SugE